MNRGLLLRGTWRFLIVLTIFLTGQISDSWAINKSEGETITLTARNVTLAKVFKTIYEQTKRSVFYSTDLLNDKETVTVNFRNTPLNDVLVYLLKDKRISWEYRGKRDIILMPAKDATFNSTDTLLMITELTGTVTANQDVGPPCALAGATVQVLGMTKATSTDANGKFILNEVPAKSTIIISHIGFETQKISVKGKRNVFVQLQASQKALDETVVVAYNTTTKNANTAAITVVKGETIQHLPNRSFDKSLQGLVPGLLVTNGTGQPGGGLSNFVLRGIATAADPVGGTTVRNPLIIIDGLPVSQEHAQLYIDNTGGTNTPVNNPLAQLNPSDIETISVLKDAAAIALYGSKASNGVILITTKRGRSGRTQFNFSHQTDIASRLAGKERVLSREEYLELLYETYKNTPNSPEWADESILSDLKKKFPTQSDGSFYPTPDWLRELYDNSATTISNQLSMSGGNEKSNFYINLEYTKQNGIIKKTGYDRKGLRFNFEHRPVDWLKVGFNTTMSYSVQDYGGANMGGDASASSILLMPPLNPIRYADGSYVFNYPSQFTSNPAAAAEYNINRNTAFRGLGKIYGEIAFLKNVKLTSSLGVDFMLSEAKEKADPRLKDPGLDYATGGRVEERDTRQANVITTNTLRFDKILNEKHAIGVILGQEAQILNRKSLYVGISGLTSPYYDQINSPNANFIRPGGFLLKETLQSFFGQATYGFKSKYFFSGSIRTDGSSRFGEDKRYGTYWSTGVGWILSEEAFVKAASSWLSYLKIRGSIGAAGNASAIDRFTPFDRLGTGSYLGNPSVYPGSSTAGNPDAQWEETFSWDAGLELRLLQDRVGVTADIYQRKTSDLIYQINLPLSSGYTTVLANIGDMGNKGIELSASADIIRNPNFRWNINANWSTNKNVLTKANDPLPSGFINGILANKVGENFNSYYLARWAGVNPEDGSPQWYDHSGKPTSDYDAAKREFVGKPQPDGYGAITNTVSFKGIELSALLYYQYGYQIYNADGLINDGAAPYNNQSRRALNRWQKPGDIAENPKRMLNNSSGGTNPSTRFLFDGDYIRLQNVTITYNFPRNITARLHLNALKVFVQGHNLALWTSFPGSQDAGNISIAGRSVNNYPNQRSFSAGFNVNF